MCNGNRLVRIKRHCATSERKQMGPSEPSTDRLEGKEKYDSPILPGTLEWPIIACFRADWLFQIINMETGFSVTLKDSAKAIDAKPSAAILAHNVSL